MADRLLQLLNTTDKAVFQGDNNARARTLQAARALVQRLQEPWERMYEIVYSEPLIACVMKIAKDLRLYSHLDATPKTIEQLASSTESDPALLTRVVRALVAAQVVGETDHGFTGTDLSAALSDPEGLANGIDLLLDDNYVFMSRLPAYFQSHGYKNPTSIHSAPWKWIMNVPEDSAAQSRWDWMEQSPNGTKTQTFQSWLASIRRDQVPIPQAYDLQRVLAAWDPDTPFWVDVGGGKGRDISHVAAAVHPTHPDATFTLQDRPAVIQQALHPHNALHPRVEPQVHDFFLPQPVQHARVYFEHSVLHDWPDAQAREILTQIKSAMKPGYSRLLMNEWVVPENARDTPLQVACMDMQMMLNFSALERTEQQWKDLVESVGLTYLGFQPGDGLTRIIEAEL